MGNIDLYLTLHIELLEHIFTTISYNTNMYNFLHESILDGSKIYIYNYYRYYYYRYSLEGPDSNLSPRVPKFS